MRLTTSIFTIALAAAPTLAVDLSNNLAQATGGTESASGSRILAASFTTGASSASIGSVTLLLANPTAGQAQLALYSSAGLEPASLVATFVSPPTYSATLAPTTFTSPGISANANSTYWVVLSASSGAFDWAWAGDSTGTGTGFTHVWGVSDDAAAFWWSFDTYPLQMSVSTAVACYANCDGSTTSPTLNALDFSCFLTAFAAGQSYANCDNSTAAPVLNALDFGCFLSAFAAGCS